MSSSMAAGQPKDGQGSPLDENKDRTPTQRERTPDKPSSEEKKDQPGEKPGEEKDGKKKDGSKPNSPEETKQLGQNKAGEPPPSEAGRPVAVNPDADRWGELPARTRETFRNQGRNDLPVQYRDWIDAYYKRLSKER